LPLCGLCFFGNADCIILSGEIFDIKQLTDCVIARIEKLGKVVVFNNVNDMDALAYNASLVLSGEADVLAYK
jgi:butyrate kinase